MSSLYTYELAVLFICPLASICLIGLILHKKNKQLSISKLQLGLIILPLFFMLYPIIKLNSINNDLEDIAYMLNVIEQEPHSEEAKLALKERVSKVQNRPFSNVSELKTMAKASFAIGDHKRCMHLAGLILKQKPFDEDALRLETLSKSIKD